VASEPRQFLTDDSADLLNAAEKNINIGKEIREQAKLLIKESMNSSRCHAKNVNETFGRDLGKKEFIKVDIFF
jgi:hypothetical protein